MKESNWMIISNWICSVLMLLSIGVYLILGFLTNLWHPGWLIIACTAIFCGIVSVSLSTIDKIKKNRQEANNPTENK